MDLYQDVSKALLDVGLMIRGGFHEEGHTLYLVGHGGSSFWGHFTESPFSDLKNDPLDQWSKEVVGRIAKDLKGEAIYPSDGPPYAPFQQWIKKAEGLYQSPLGIMIHPEFGLWHAYRAALRFEGEHQLPEALSIENFCETCAEKPCLKVCPVDAFSGVGYDVPNCVSHLKGPDQAECMSYGCHARRACPHGQSYRYKPDHAAFHMKAFRRNH